MTVRVGVRGGLRKLWETRIELKERMVFHFVQLLPANEILLVCARCDVGKEGTSPSCSYRGGGESKRAIG